MWSSLKSCLALEVCWKCGASKESANPEMCYVNLSRDAPWRHVSVAMWSTQPSFAKIAPCLHERGEATLYTNLYRLKILQLILFDRLARLVLENMLYFNTNRSASRKPWCHRICYTAGILVYAGT